MNTNFFRKKLIEDRLVNGEILILVEFLMTLSLSSISIIEGEICCWWSGNVVAAMMTDGPDRQ
jgi:hypothetical protein